MPWVYLDDHFDEHPKVIDAFELDTQAPLLFVSSLAYCRRGDTSGRVPGTKVRALLGYRPKAHRALLAVELWHKVGPGETIEVHDYAEWNGVAETRSASARNAARIRWGKERNERNKS
jgi:hypothetical protein